eukprot:350797_1
MRPSSINLLSQPKFSDNDFQLNKKYIDYELLDTNITSWYSKFTCSFSNFMSKMKGYDSVVINLGAHYNRRKNDDNMTAIFKRNKFKYVINFIANILKHDMRKNSDHVHIWRMSFPSHYWISWWDARAMNKTCSPNTEKKKNAIYSLNITKKQTTLSSQKIKK